MKKERLIELQKTADEAKYLKGWEESYDPSGEMPFCDHCSFKGKIGCTLAYSDRLDTLACGKAYAKYVAAELEEIIK